MLNESTILKQRSPRKIPIIEVCQNCYSDLVNYEANREKIKCLNCKVIAKPALFKHKLCNCGNVGIIWVASKKTTFVNFNSWVCIKCGNTITEKIISGVGVRWS